MLVEQLIAHYGGNLTLTYSRYTVAPPRFQAAAPRSPVLHVPVLDVTREWLIDRLEALGPAEEMALHSSVEHRGATFHIPMIDFVGRPPNSLLLEVGRLMAVEARLSKGFIFFDTGRSLHGYSPELIPEHDWRGYLGRLIVLNEDDHAPMIDTRWVGHALVRGFAALRWSHNTSRYLAMPSLASIPDPALLGGLRHPLDATAAGHTSSQEAKKDTAVQSGLRTIRRP